MSSLDKTKALEQLALATAERDEIVSLHRSNVLPQLVQTRKSLESQKNTLKSDLKKTTAFVKKIRSAINSEGLQQCLRDVETLNLTLYITEIVAAITEVKFKATDIPSVVKLCVALHRRYEEFTSALIHGLKVTLLSAASSSLLSSISATTSAIAATTTIGGNAATNEQDKTKRILIRFTIELFMSGVFAEDRFFLELLRSLLGTTKNGDGSKQPIDLLGLSTFVKYGCEVFGGFYPRRLITLTRAAELPSERAPLKQFLTTTTSVTTEMKELLQSTYQSLSTELQDQHKKMTSLEKRFEKDKLLHGSLTEAKQSRLEEVKRHFEKLHMVVTSFNDFNEFEFPVLEEEEEVDEESKGISVWEGSSSSTTAATFAELGPYSDLETKSFYEEFPDLFATTGTTVISLSALGISNEQAIVLQEQWTKNNSNSAGNAAAEESSSGGGDDLADSLLNGDDNNNEDEAATTATATLNDGSNDDTSEDSPGIKLSQLINDKLYDCYNSRQRCDEFCLQFLRLLPLFKTPATAKKRLATALSIGNNNINKSPRLRHNNNSELVAGMARVLKTLQQIFPDFGKVIVVEQLSRDFFRQQQRLSSTGNNNNLTLSSLQQQQQQTIRYIGELIKFKVVPPMTAFRMCKQFLSDFTIANNVESMSLLLETCGRYLYCLSYAQQQVESLLETMMRLRRVKQLDLRLQSLVETSYFSVKPPEQRQQRATEEYSTVERYARYLIMERLHAKSVSIDNIINSIRKLPWFSSQQQASQTPLSPEALQQQQQHQHLVKVVIDAFVHMAKTNYDAIPSLADCVSGLFHGSHGNLTIRLVDTLLQQLTQSLEMSSSKRQQQQQLGIARFISELYNYEVLASGVVFDVLYLLLQHGHDVNPSLNNSFAVKTKPPSMKTATCFFNPVAVVNEIDSPTDCYRIQVICEILTHCGIYFVYGSGSNNNNNTSNRQRLSTFLLYFQHYLFSKISIPQHTEFTLLDLFDNLEELARKAIMEENAVAAAAAAAQDKKKKSSKNKSSKNSKDSDTDGNNHRIKEIVGFVFPRFESLEELTGVIAALEEKTAVDFVNNVNANNNNNNSNEEEDCEDEEEIDNDVGDKNKHNRKHAGNDEEEVDDGESNNNDSDNDNDDDEDDENNNDDEDEEEEEEEDDGAGALAAVLASERAQAEDDEFEKAFKSLMLESVESVRVKSSTSDMSRMAIPAILPKPKNIIPRSLEDDDDDDDDDDNNNNPSSSSSSSNNNNNMKSFKLLGRDARGRVETRQLLVPEQSALATAVSRSEAQLKAERQKLKEKVLLIQALNEQDGYYEGNLGNNINSNSVNNNNNNNNGKMTEPHAAQRQVPSTGSSNKTFSNNNNTNGNNNKNNGDKIVVLHHRNQQQLQQPQQGNVTHELNLDQFLAESDAAEIRKISTNSKRTDNNRR